MDCQRVRKEIPLYIDGQLAPQGREAVAAHLESCGACRREAAAARKLLSLLCSQPERQVSSSFDQRLYARLESAGAHSSLLAPVRRWLQQKVDATRARARVAYPLGLAGAVALAAALWVAVPGKGGLVKPADAAYVDQCVRQHEVLESMPAEEEVVQYSIAQSTGGSVSESN